MRVCVCCQSYMWDLWAAKLCSATIKYIQFCVTSYKTVIMTYIFEKNMEGGTFPCDMFMVLYIRNWLYWDVAPWHFDVWGGWNSINRHLSIHAATFWCGIKYTKFQVNFAKPSLRCLVFCLLTAIVTWDNIVLPCKIILIKSKVIHGACTMYVIAADYFLVIQWGDTCDLSQTRAMDPYALTFNIYDIICWINLGLVSCVINDTFIQNKTSF